MDTIQLESMDIVVSSPLFPYKEWRNESYSSSTCAPTLSECERYMIVIKDPIVFGSYFITRQKSTLRTWGAMFRNTIERTRNLLSGWDGSEAISTSDIAIQKSLDFLNLLVKINLQPSMVSPSVIGGIGFTFLKDKKEVFIEFYNNGEIYSLFTEHTTEYFEPIINRVTDYNSLMRRIEEHVG